MTSAMGLQKRVTGIGFLVLQTCSNNEGTWLLSLIYWSTRRILIYAAPGSD
jgi:hypothetical protein